MSIQGSECLKKSRRRVTKSLSLTYNWIAYKHRGMVRPTKTSPRTGVGLKP
jgi:hypothetical protein